MKNRKSLGQHWLKDRDILIDIADHAATDGAEVVVEIGPGLGTLTSALFQFFPQVIAVELDDRLAENLPKSFPGKNLQVVHKDVNARKRSFSSSKKKSPNVWRPGQGIIRFSASRRRFMPR